MKSAGTSSSQGFRPRFERVRKPIEVRLPPGGIAVVESHHAPGFEPTRLRHDFAKLILVIGGRGTLEAEGRRWEMSADILLHVPAGIAHRIADVPNAPVALYAVCFRSESAPLRIQWWKLGSRARTFRADVREMLFEQQLRRVGWELALRSRLGDLLVRCARFDERRAKSVAAAGVEDYLARLATQFYRQESLDDAAAACGLSRRRFTALFRQLTGQSWRERVQALRLQHARMLLTETTKPVISVAFESGFDDVSNFHRTFKRATGSSPAQYREKKRT